MDSLSNQLPPGTDLCKIPAGIPPPGKSSNLDSTYLANLLISLGIIITTIAVVFGLGRLYVNFRKLTVGDSFVLVAVISNTTTLVLMSFHAKYFRHIWDMPLCWLNDYSGKLAIAWQILATFSTFPGRVATLLLFYQLFTISRPISTSIWIGIAFSFIITAGSISLESYGYAHAKTRDSPDDANGLITLWTLQWGIAGAVADTLVDIYIFILPLPIIFRLNMSKKKKLQVSAIFFIGLLGIVVSIVALAYRIVALRSHNVDNTYNTGLVMIFSLVQMNVTLIICSTTAFVSLIRFHLLESQTFKAFRSMLGSSSSASSRPSLIKSWQGPNRPRTGRNETPKQKHRSLRDMADYTEVSDTCLLNSGGPTIDVEGQRNVIATGDINKDEGTELRILKTRDIDHDSVSLPSEPGNTASSIKAFDQEQQQSIT
ncbi:hypothetical protein F5Y11DRAFT_324380 [Daldinia sp. FL1419]|nr:hypothetical protein F5Y11DRAFT_324380 [Daldinia sp. FL1419]